MIQRANARIKRERFRKREGFEQPEACPDLAAVERNPSCPLGTRDSGLGRGTRLQEAVRLLTGEAQTSDQRRFRVRTRPTPTPSPGNSSTQSADHLPQNFKGQEHRLHFTELTSFVLVLAPGCLPAHKTGTRDHSRAGRSSVLKPFPCRVTL